MDVGEERAGIVVSTTCISHTIVHGLVRKWTCIQQAVLPPHHDPHRFCACRVRVFGPYNTCRFVGECLIETKGIRGVGRELLSVTSQLIQDGTIYKRAGRGGVQKDTVKREMYIIIESHEQE